jgi:hypothetical protein
VHDFFFSFYYKIKEASAHSGSGRNEKVIRTIQYSAIHAESIKDKGCTETFVGEMVEGDAMGYMGRSQGFDNLAGGWEHIQAMGESASLIV